MKHSIAELLDVVYRHYPRGIDLVEQADIQRYEKTEEYVRLVATRRRAAADERWHALLRRMHERFPSGVMNRSLHLPTGSMDACYSFSISAPNATDSRMLWFHISFLVPYYFVYSWRLAQVVRQPDRFTVNIGGVKLMVPRSPRDPELLLNPADERVASVTLTEPCVSFDLSADEQPCAEWVTRDIKATFGCERMPPEIGTVLVPNVALNRRALGQARLYDCLFTDDNEWVRPLPCEVEAAVIEVDPSSLTKPFAAVLTVLAALYRIAWILWYMDQQMQGALCLELVPDGVLRKADLLAVLAEFRPLIESPRTPRVIAVKHGLEAATHELEALVASWDGEGEPPAPMVAWASSFLANWREFGG